MRILIATSSSDSEQFQWLVESMLHFRALENHFITIVPTASQVFAAEQAAVKLREICPQTTVEAMPDDPMGGWPRASNTQFIWAMQRMKQIGNTQPILWLEGDCIVKEKFWADKIATQYSALNKPFMGVIVDTKDEINRPDKLMMGVGVYPANFLNVTRLWKDLGPAAMSAPIAFDRYMRHEIVSFAAHTKLIGDRWRTQNYRSDFSCESASTDPKNPGRVDGDISEAVIVHGCKDRSLLDVVLGRSGQMPQTFDQAIEAQQKVFESMPQSATACGAASGPTQEKTISGDILQEILAIVTETRDMVKQISARQADPSQATAPYSSPAAVGATSGGEDTGGHSSAASGSGTSQTGQLSPTGIWPVLRQHLSQRKWQLGALAEQVHLPKDQLRELLESKGYEIGHPLPWIKEPQPKKRLLAKAV